MRKKTLTILAVAFAVLLVVAVAWGVQTKSRKNISKPVEENNKQAQELLQQSQTQDTSLNQKTKNDSQKAEENSNNVPEKKDLSKYDNLRNDLDSPEEVVSKLYNWYLEEVNSCMLDDNKTCDYEFIHEVIKRNFVTEDFYSNPNGKSIMCSAQDTPDRMDLSYYEMIDGNESEAVVLAHLFYSNSGDYQIELKLISVKNSWRISEVYCEK